MVQEAKFRVKNLVRQLCAEGFNSGVKGLMGFLEVGAILVHLACMINHFPSKLRCSCFLHVHGTENSVRLHYKMR
jgi:hypothetical protein